jgi:predicted ribosomally synthesized peptide with SipW-like signal peptide
VNKNRRWLFLLLAAGLIALGAGGGTFATFNAQTANQGNSFATGTLYLSDTVSGTACFSFTGSNNQNTTSPTGCGTVIDVSGQKPGSSPNSNPATGTVTLKNIGTLAGDLTASSSACTDTPLSATTTANLTSGSKSITVTSATGILVGMQVVDNTTAANLPTPEYVTSVSGTTVTLTSNAAATATGDSLSFTSTSTGSLCSALDVFITDGTTCYYGLCPTGEGGGSAETLANLSGATIFSPALSLPSGSSTALTVGLYLPDGGSNGADNNLMALESTFDLTFTLTQS